MKKFISIFTTSLVALVACLTMLVAAFAEPLDDKPALEIRALNPGYTVEGKQNVGEFIELEKSADDILSLTGYALRYTNGSGTASMLFEFPEGSTMTGGVLLLRLASSPEAGMADVTYTKTLAMAAGPLELLHNGEVVDTVCWTGKDGCYPKFNSAKPTTLARNEDTGLFEHLTTYTPEYDPDNPSYHGPPIDPEPEVEPRCRGLRFSEILSYYENSNDEQFVEIYNATDHNIDTTGCQVRYKKKNYPLSGVIPPDGYLARYATDFSLTKNPTSSNDLSLIDVDGNTVDTLTYYNGQKKATAYAAFGYQNNGQAQWLQTYHPTPGEANDYQKYKTCPVGKVINEETGNCVNASTLDTALAPCPAGKYRNPLTNRCKSIDDDDEKEPCPEGYERNPETGRCRKIRNNDGADYALEPDSFGDTTSFVAIGVIAILVAIGLTYVVVQYRHEIARFFRNLWHKTPFSKKK